jgi:ferredoxin-NADP reductase
VLELRIDANQAATPTSRIVRLGLDGLTFSYEAGQAVWLAAVPDGEFTPYSLASAPEDTARHGMLEFLVKVDRSTRFGARVTTLVPGDRVVVRGPAGSFVMPRNLDRASLLFIAGGTGIAPLRSMIRHARDSGFDNRLSLIYSARTPEEFAYLGELRTLAAEGALDLNLTLTGEGTDWAHSRGRIDRERLAPLVAAPEVFAFICGPTSMLVEVSGTLKELGLPESQIRMETW